MEEKEEMLTLLDDDGNEHLFSIVDLLTVQDSQYAILLPLEQGEEAAEEGEEAIIFKVIEDDDGQALLAVEDDEEWDKVATAWENKKEELDGGLDGGLDRE